MRSTKPSPYVEGPPDSSGTHEIDRTLLRMTIALTAARWIFVFNGIAFILWEASEVAFFAEGLSAANIIEVIVVSFIAPVLMWFSTTRGETLARDVNRAHRELFIANETSQREITERKRAEAEREKLITELQEALAEVNTLSGMLPICASCKKIRDDKGYWNQIETYLHEHSGTEFSHSICPQCMKTLYPDLKASHILSGEISG